MNVRCREVRQSQVRLCCRGIDGQLQIVALDVDFWASDDLRCLVIDNRPGSVRLLQQQIHDAVDDSTVGAIDEGQFSMHGPTLGACGFDPTEDFALSKVGK